MLDKEWLTTKQVAKIFGVEPNTVSRWRIAGKLNEVSMISTAGGHHRYNAADVNRLLDKHEDPRIGD